MSDSPSLASGTMTGNRLVVAVLTDQLSEAAVAYRLRDEMVALIEQHRPQDLIIDLARTDFVGSVGFLAFLGVRRQLPEGRIVLCNLSDPIREMFAVCRLIQTETNRAAPFEVAGSVGDGLARLAS